jgi:hypothetical protein
MTFGNDFEEERFDDCLELQNHNGQIIVRLDDPGKVANLSLKMG